MDNSSPPPPLIGIVVSTATATAAAISRTVYIICDILQPQFSVSLVLILLADHTQQSRIAPYTTNFFGPIFGLFRYNIPLLALLPY
mmetsp:Transcript_26901/g.59060  ORF Transcript_26901/g.59060 Transcript_26901/m.59060 type:complete len:86 (-) Transcript_26901:111-368(-)